MVYIPIVKLTILVLTFNPDVLQIFIKPSKDLKSILSYTAVPLATCLGILPVTSLFSGAARVVNAVKAIFKELSNPKGINKSELWNAFKNLFRGIAEMIPFTGIALIVFESMRASANLGKVLLQLEKQENIAGIAIDGKLILTIDLEKLDRVITEPHPTKPNEYRLAVFQDLCLKFLKKAEEQKKNMGMSELLSKLANLA